MQFNRKIKAGSLQFVLFISATVTVLLLAFVLLHHTHSIFYKKTSKTIEVIKKANMGIQYAMEQNLPLNDSVVLNPRWGGDVEVSVLKSYWGVFEKYGVVSKFQKNQFIKTALVGSGLGDDFPALYLKDNDRPMIIVGTSKIIGDAYLPKQGIKPGTINGQFHQYTSPVYGEIRRSTSSLPALDIAFKNQLNQLLNSNVGFLSDNRVHFSEHMKLANSFESPTQYIYGDVLRLSDVDIQGNVLIKATVQIMVNAKSNLKDVVLVAPKIDIGNGFKGTLQAFASEKINVGKGAILEYPSTIVVDKGNVSNPEDGQDSNIVIEKGATIRGSVSYFENIEKKSFVPQIVISLNASVFGEVYCEKNLELKGSVVGNVITDSFIAMENGSVYQNHLFQGTINASLLPKQYVGLLLNEEKAVAKWVH